MVQAYAQATKSGKLELSDAAIAFGKFPFSGLTRETSQRAATPVYESKSELGRIVKAWEKVREMTFEHMGEERNEQQAYANVSVIIEFIERIRCSARDLEEFVAILPLLSEDKNFEERMGFFISALINLGPDQRYVLHLEHIDHELMFIGMFNEKEIEVWGDVGAHAGYGMRSGKLKINGNAGMLLGEMMRDGTLEITGNAYYNAGQEMLGGCLTIGGNTAGWVGCKMYAGEIIVRGDAGSHVGCSMYGGTVTINGNAGEKVGYNATHATIRIGGTCKGIDNVIWDTYVFVGGVQAYPSPVPKLVPGSVPEPKARLE